MRYPVGNDAKRGAKAVRQARRLNPEHLVVPWLGDAQPIKPYDASARVALLWAAQPSCTTRK